MISIELNNLSFHAFHGLYREEQKIGGEFTVNVSVMVQPVQLPVTDFKQSIDYTQVYQLVCAHMQQPQLLLETVSTGIAIGILRKFSQATEVKVSISKLNPPIIAFRGSVGVQCTINRSML